MTRSIGDSTTMGKKNSATEGGVLETESSLQRLSKQQMGLLYGGSIATGKLLATRQKLDAYAQVDGLAEASDGCNEVYIEHMQEQEIMMKFVALPTFMLDIYACMQAGGYEGCGVILICAS